MREFIDKHKSKEIIKKYKKDEACCFIKLNGKKLKTKEEYYEKLSKKLQLNATFSNNYNAYSDMMRDEYTYYNKDTIIFVIKNYDHFLQDDHSKSIIEKIFDTDIIPEFEHKQTIHVYCVK